MTKRITLATIKSWMKKNEGRIYVQERSRFDGSIDAVSYHEAPEFNLAQPSYNPHKNNFNMRGVWFVFGGGDCYTPYDDGKFQGYEVYNCCGSFILATLKA